MCNADPDEPRPARPHAEGRLRARRCAMSKAMLLCLKRSARGPSPGSCRHLRPGRLSAQRPDSSIMQLEVVEPALAASGKGAKPRAIHDSMDRMDSPGDILLRRLEDGDSIEDLTDMLHRAFSRIGAMGIPCICANQPAEVTRQRISRGDCFVALSGDLIIGTMTLYPPDPASDSKYYRNDGVGSLRQFAVDPPFHDLGIGSAMLHFAENWALRRGYLWLALDTPEPADHLIDYYQRQGFCCEETLQFAGRPYRSVVFSKSVADRNIAKRRPYAIGGNHCANPVRATANGYAAPLRSERLMPRRPLMLRQSGPGASGAALRGNNERRRARPAMAQARRR